MNTTLVFNSRRSTLYSREGIVAASQPLAVAAGIEILKQSGNAADAAIATAAALNATEPYSTGLGGDAFALFYKADEQKVYALNGSGRSGSKLTLQRLIDEGFKDQTPPRHAYNVTVPGACAAWCDLVERFGKLSMAGILSPAIKLADEGFPVAPLTSYYWQESARDVLSKAMNGQELTIDGRGPDTGEVFHNPGLARTLQIIADRGKESFYQGEVAEAIISIVQKAGGCLEMEDLAEHKSTWVDPISTTYHGTRIWECPPNGQGITALIALNILEGFNIHELPPLSAERLHLEIEAIRLAFEDSKAYVADPDFAPLDYNKLIDKDYAKRHRDTISLKRANPNISPGALTKTGDTVYLSVVDKEGNACSFINSTYMYFGSGIVPVGYGFSLQNRGHNFSLDPSHPNCVAPRKRPYHTIIPAMATNNDGSLFASFGVMGGFMQPQGHVQVLIGMINDGLDPQSALDRPRFCLDVHDKAGMVAIEEGIPNESITKLEEMGHPVRQICGVKRSLFGRGQIIQQDPLTRVFYAGSDPRADGCAMSYV